MEYTKEFGRWQTDKTSSLDQLSLIQRALPITVSIQLKLREIRVMT